MEEEKLVSVGDRVTVRGHDGMFFVLASSDGWQTVTLLPPNNGKVLDNVPVSSLTIIARPGPNGATRS
jgi:hypothetical protein